MPSTTLLKPDPDEDFYVLWINGADGPGAWGTRSDVEAALTRPVFDPDDRDPARFERADATGWSTIDAPGSFRGMAVGGRGWMPRSKMRAWCQAGMPRAMLEETENQVTDRRRAAAAESAES